MALAQATRLTAPARALLTLAACAMATACAGLPQTSNLAPPATIDPNSPIAREVASAAASKDPYPTFTRIPATPTDIRPTRAWSRSIYDSLRLRRQLIVEASLFPPAPTDTAEFAARQRSATGASAPSANAATTGSASAFVEQGRERATPPSPTR